MKVIDYAVFSAPDALSMGDLVKALLPGGWQPLGGASVMWTGSAFIYAQAMVKYEPEDQITVRQQAIAIDSKEDAERFLEDA